MATENNSGAMTSTQGDNSVLAAQLLMAEVTRAQKGHFYDKAITWLMSDVLKTIASKESRAQSNAGAPVTFIKDLSKMTGADTVKVDLLHKINPLPVMNGRMGEGREVDTTRSTLSTTIGYYRVGVRDGSPIDQQRRGYNLVKVGRAELQDYFPRLKSELLWTHAAGVRGSYMADDVILPPTEPSSAEATAELREIYVNPLSPPTFNRQFYAGNADSIDGTVGSELTAAHTLQVDDIERMGVELAEMAHPPRAATLSMKSTYGSSHPFYFLFVTPRQYADCKRVSTQFNSYVAEAVSATKGFDHPIFGNQGFMVGNIYVCQYFFPIRFYEGDLVPVRENDMEGTIGMQQVPAGVTVDRAILMGAQALHFAIGAVKPGQTFELWKGKYDTGDRTRQWMKWMAGIGKNVFKSSGGWLTDYGLCYMDTHVTNATRPQFPYNN